MINSFRSEIVSHVGSFSCALRSGSVDGCKSKWARRHEGSVPSLLGRAGCGSTVFPGARMVLGDHSAGAARQCWCQNLLQRNRGPFLGQWGASTGCGVWGYLCKPLNLGWVLQSCIAALSIASSVPCCVRLGGPAGSLVLRAQCGVETGKQWLGEDGLVTGKTVSCCAGAEALKYQDRSPEIPAALGKPCGSLLPRQSPMCWGSCGWVGQWCSAPGKGIPLFPIAFFAFQRIDLSLLIPCTKPQI